jgi:serine/threonine protein kinase
MYVATRWYRAPELIIANGYYSEAVDVWSCGCILAELFNRRPLFKSVHNPEQLRMMIKTIGTPSAADLAEMGGTAILETIKDAPYSDGVSFKDQFPTASPVARDLLERMLTFNPVGGFSFLETSHHRRSSLATRVFGELCRLCG